MSEVHLCQNLRNRGESSFLVQESSEVFGEEPLLVTYITERKQSSCGSLFVFPLLGVLQHLPTHD